MTTLSQAISAADAPSENQATANSISPLLSLRSSDALDDHLPLPDLLGR